MKTIVFSLFFGVFVITAAFDGLAFPAEGAKPELWFVDSLVKVFPEDSAGKNAMAEAVVTGPRNGHASIQLALRPDRRMEKVTASVEGLGKDKADVQVRRVGYVVVAKNTAHTPQDELVHSAPGLFPDVLFEDSPFSLEVNKTQSLWLTLAIPGDAPVGSYRAEVVVREGGEERIRAPFTLKIAAATVPRQTLKVTNWFYLSDRQLKTPFKVRALSEEWWKLIENIGRVMAEHRQNMIVTPLTGFYFSKVSLIQAKLGPKGLEYDFSNFDRWVETFQKAGVIGYIEGSHVIRREDDWEDEPTGPLKVDVFIVEDGKPILKSLIPDDPRAPQALSEMLSAFHRHLKEKGWLDIYYQHVLDEPRVHEMANYVKYSELVHRAMPGARTVDAISAEDDLAVFEKSADVWVPVLATFDNLVERLHKHSERGGEVWYYTCSGPTGRYANRFIDYSLVKVRLLQWLNFRYGLTGFLHWGGNYWSPDPLSETELPLGGGGTHPVMLPSGDAFIAYPDPERSSILSSIRLEVMTEAIEDYELLKALEAKNPATATHLASRMIRSFTDYTREPGEFRQIHLELLDALAKQQPPR